MGMHWFGKSALTASVIVLVPWTIGMATQLPASTVARHWNTAWAGLDVGITIGLALTTWLIHRRDRRVALSATATATLMCADAWFDICTSAPGSSLTVAVVEAAAELALVAACLAVALHTYRAAEQLRRIT